MPLNAKNARLVPADESYTTLLIVAAVFLLIGSVFLAVRSYQIFGSVWPVGGG